MCFINIDMRKLVLLFLAHLEHNSVSSVFASETFKKPSVKFQRSQISETFSVDAPVRRQVENTQDGINKFPNSPWNYQISPRQNYQYGPSLDYPNYPHTNYMNNPLTNYQNDQQLNYQNGLQPNYQNGQPPNYQEDQLPKYQNNQQLNYQNGLQPNYQNGPPPNYQNDYPPSYQDGQSNDYQNNQQPSYQNGPLRNYQGRPLSYQNGQNDNQEGQPPNLRQLPFDPHAALFEFTLPPKFAKLLHIGKNETPETYHEPYYKGGQWVFSRVSKATTRDLSLKSIRAHGYQKGGIRPDKGNECDVDCLPIYWKDFGPVCGFKQSFKDHKSKWMKFNNMCELEYQNCRAYTQRPGWILVHRGDCPEDAVGKSGYYLDPFGNGAAFYKSRAIAWLSQSYPTPSTRDDDLVTKK